MNKVIGEEMGTMLGNIIDVNCDLEGGALGRCIPVRVLLNVHTPLVRWTNFSMGGTSRKVLFRYEKLADYCYACGRTDHLSKNCNYTHPDGLCHYGPWLRADGQNPISLEEVAGELNRLNARKLAHNNVLSPHTPINNTNANSPTDIPLIPKSKTDPRGLPPIPCVGLNSISPIAKPNELCKGGPSTLEAESSKPNWDVLVPKPKTSSVEIEEMGNSKAQGMIGGGPAFGQQHNFIHVNGTTQMENPDHSFLQNLYLSPALSANYQNPYSFVNLQSISPFNPEAALIPTNQSFYYFDRQDPRILEGLRNLQ